MHRGPALPIDFQYNINTFNTPNRLLRGISILEKRFFLSLFLFLF